MDKWVKNISRLLTISHSIYGSIVLLQFFKKKKIITFRKIILTGKSFFEVVSEVQSCSATRCFKITEKVVFNFASEASYVYILSGQKFIKKCQKWSNLESFWKSEACGQTELPDRSTLIGQKLVENAKIKKFNYDILGAISLLLW